MVHRCILFRDDGMAWVSRLCFDDVRQTGGVNSFPSAMHRSFLCLPLYIGLELAVSAATFLAREILRLGERNSTALRAERAALNPSYPCE